MVNRYKNFYTKQLNKQKYYVSANVDDDLGFIYITNVVSNLNYFFKYCGSRVMKI